MKKARWIMVVFISLLLPTVPQSANAQDYIAPGETILSNPSYPQITLDAGWNTVGVLPMTRFYFDATKDGSTMPATNDLQYWTKYSSRAAMLQAAFGIDPSDWSKVETIQMWYPENTGITGGLLVYGRDIPEQANTLNFVMTGYSAWIKVDSAITLTPVQPDGPQPTPFRSN